MGKFLKIFFIFLYTIFSLVVNTSEASYLSGKTKVNIIQKSNQENSIILDFYGINNTSIIASNNNGFEISALKNDCRNDFSTSDNSVNINNFFEQLKKYYLNIFSTTSKNIYTNLRNTICIRAP